MMTKWLILSVLVLEVLTAFSIAASEDASHLSSSYGRDFISNPTSAQTGDLEDPATGNHSMNDANYSRKLKHILKDYINASFLLAAISHVDIDRVSLEELKGMAEMNRLQWVDIERESIELLNETEGPSGNGSETLIIQSSSDPTPSSKDGEFTTSIGYVIEHAPRGHVIRSLMEQFGFSARDAMSAVIEINNLNAEIWNNRANRAERFERALTIVRDTSFAAVQYAGLVAAGPEIATASGLVRAYRATSFAINGLDFGLAVGQLGTEIFQADSGTAMITSVRDNFGPLTLITGWFDHRVMLREQGLLVPFGEGGVWTNIYATFEDFKRRFTELKPRANSASQNAAPIADQPMAVPVINLDLTKPSGNVEIEWSPELYDRYIAPDSSEILTQNIPRVFPEGFYRIDGEGYEVGPSIADEVDESNNNAISEDDTFCCTCPDWTNITTWQEEAKTRCGGGMQYEVGPSIAGPIPPDCREECPADAKCLTREEAKKKCDEEKKFCGEASNEPCGCNGDNSKFCFSSGCPTCAAVDPNWAKAAEAFLN